MSSMTGTGGVQHRARRTTAVPQRHNTMEGPASCAQDLAAADRSSRRAAADAGLEHTPHTATPATPATTATPATPATTATPATPATTAENR